MTNNYLIRRTQEKDLISLVNLHFQYLPTNFRDCKYSRNLIALFYKSFLRSDINMSFVAELNGLIVGYICIVRSLKELYLTMLKKHYLIVFINLSGLIIYQKDTLNKEIINIGKSLFRKPNNDLLAKNSLHHILIMESQPYELRPIVVRHDYHGTGLASALIARAEAALKERKVRRYFLRVSKDNLRAINFYRKTEFIDVGSEGSETLVMEKILK
jgi:ribosomal protein S18 acetylase RimI-like enzyme